METELSTQYQEALKKLDEFKTQAIREEIEGYSEEYRKSEWYREPTLIDAVGDNTANDICSFYNDIFSGKENIIRQRMDKFEAMAKEYGRSWWDEDIGLRTGYEYETRVYTHLRNIAAEIIGLKAIDWQDYYEGRGV